MKRRSKISCASALLFVSPLLLSSTASLARTNQWSYQKVETPQTLQATEVDNLVQAAAQAYEKGKLDDVLVNCARATAINPNDFRVHTIAGLAYVGLWKMKSASAEFATVIRLRPQWKDGYVLKAKADIELGAADEAIAGCRKALELDPNYADAYATIGDALQRDDKRQTEAVNAYQSALKLDPKFFRVYESLGQLFLDLKDEKRAEEIFRQGMAVDSKHMSGRFELGRLLVKQAKLVEARQFWNERTSDVDHTMPTFIQLLTRAENMKHAIDRLSKTPNDPDALNEMGLAVLDGDSWVVDGRQERAIVYFRKALQIRPRFAQAQYNIVKAMVQHVDVFAKDKRRLDQELAKLRAFDPALAEEMEQYRSTYHGALIGGPPINVKQ